MRHGRGPATAGGRAFTGHPESGRRLAGETDDKQPGDKEAYDGIAFQKQIPYSEWFLICYKILIGLSSPVLERLILALT